MVRPWSQPSRSESQSKPRLGLESRTSGPRRERRDGRSSNRSEPACSLTPGAGKPRLLTQVRDAIRVRHYSLRTEEAYVAWIRRFILFHGKRHPIELGPTEIGEFLSDLAVRGHVSASTQNQALAVHTVD